jgi:hypothetical protein
MPSCWRGTSTRRKVATGEAATTLGRGLRDATAGSTSDRVRRGYSLAFPLLSPVGPSPLSNADRPRTVGTTARWDHAVHRGVGRATFHFAFLYMWLFLRGSALLDYQSISIVTIYAGGLWHLLRMLTTFNL